MINIGKNTMIDINQVGVKPAMGHFNPIHWVGLDYVILSGRKKIESIISERLLK
jgi:hypothetical protein